ncbi:hypothetical protein OF83DRAFT_1138197 [Amylostereum chailletii]|nr:hypothetical protein OF83DRAFT_1138197 [Amylostereum chailletii]
MQSLQARAPDKDRTTTLLATTSPHRTMAQRKPQIPCITDPDPKTATSTAFTCARRHFTVKDLPDDFPYDVVHDNGLQIHYFEFRAHAPPPPDLGHAGDVWLNIAPGSYALHVRVHDKWLLWPGPHKSKKNMFEHPLVPGRYLWCTRKHVLWYTCDGIRKSASLQTRGEENDFGRNRYRAAVGAADRGASRAQASANNNRLPLRTAAEAIAKILEMEEEERKQGRDQPEAKRRKIREDDGSEGGSRRASVGTLTAASPISPTSLALPSNAPAPTTPATPFPTAHLFSTTTSSLSQALGGPAPSSVSPSTHGSRPLPQVAPFNPPQRSPTQMPMPIPQMPMSQPPSSRIAPSPLPQTSQPSSHAHMSSSSSPQVTKSSPSSVLSTISLLPAPHPLPQQPPKNSALLAQMNPSPNLVPSPSPITPANVGAGSGARMAGGELADCARLQEDVRKLMEENQRLTKEVTRLSDENHRLYQHQSQLQHHQHQHQRSPLPTNMLSSSAMHDILREALNTGLGARIPSLMNEAQEHLHARREAERKLAEFQDQLKKMTQAFQISRFPGGGDNSLSTPGPSPRMNPTDT